MCSRRFSSLFGKLFMTLVVVVTAYSVAGFVILPLVVKNQLHRLAADMLDEEASVSSVRCNPFALTLWAKDLSLKNRESVPLVSVGELFVDFEIPRPPHWAITFARIELDHPVVHTEIDPDGRLNFARAAENLKKEKEPAELDRNATHLFIYRLIVTGGRIDFVDRSSPPPFETALEPVEIDICNFSTTSEETGNYTVTAQLSDGASLLWCGNLSLNPLASQGHFSLMDLSVPAAWRFLRHRVHPAESTGTLAFSGAYVLAHDNGKTEFSLDDMDLRAADLSLALQGREEPLLRLGSLQIDDARLDPANHEVSLGQIQVADGRLAAFIDKTGKLNWLELLPPASPQAADTKLDAGAPSPDSSPESPHPVSQEPPSSPPWKLHLPAAKIQDISVLYEDESRSAPLSLAAEHTSLQFTGDAELLDGSQAPNPALTLENLSFNAQNLSFSSPEEQEALLALNTVTISGARLDLARREASLGEIALADGKAAASTEKNGTLNWIRLLAPANTPPPKPPLPSPPPPWKLAIPKATVSGLALSYRDHSRQAPFHLTTLSAALTLSGNVEQRSDDWQAFIDPLSLQLVDTVLNVSDQAKAPLRIANIDLTEGRLDLEDRNVSIGRIHIQGGGFEAIVDEQGRPNWATLTEGKPSSHLPSRSSASKTPPSPESTGKPWHLSLDRLELKGFAGSYEDLSRPQPLSLGLQDITLTLNGLTQDGRKPVPFDASLRLNQGGRLAVNGTLQPGGPALQATVRAEEMPLTPLQPYLARLARLTLTSGRVGVTGPLKAVPRQGGGYDLSFTGGVRVDALQIDESETGSSFLSWKNMDAREIRFDLNPGLLQVGEVKLNEPQGKLFIFEDGTVNVKKVIKEPSPSPPAQTAVARKAARPTASPYGSTPFQLRVDRIRIDNGILDFADLTLTPRFGTRIHQLSGTVTGLSSANNARAKVQLEGRVDEFGFSRIQGAIQPFDPKAFSDITMTFRNVEMTRLTPYSGKFAGRRIKSGKLSADLQYRINGGKLEGDNKLVVDKLVLGEHVESEKAVNLPLDLAVALLKDSKGVINIGLPVSGDLNDPHFDFGQLIGKAFVSFITKLATAPFRLLGSLLPSLGDTPLDTIGFEAGSARVLPPEREKLQQLITAMKARPELKIEILGGYDPSADAMALKTAALRNELADRMRTKKETGEAPPDLDFSDAKTQLTLERLFAERRSEKALNEFKTAYEKESGREAKEVSRILALVGKGSRDTAYYEAMYRQLVEFQPLPDALLPELARQRAGSVKEALLENGQLPEDRVIVLAPSDSGANAVKLNLSAH